MTVQVGSSPFLQQFHVQYCMWLLLVAILTLKSVLLLAPKVVTAEASPSAIWIGNCPIKGLELSLLRHMLRHMQYHTAWNSQSMNMLVIECPCPTRAVMAVAFNKINVSELAYGREQNSGCTAQWFCAWTAVKLLVSFGIIPLLFFSVFPLSLFHRKPTTHFD